MLKTEFIEFIYRNKIMKLGTVQLKNGDYSDHIYDFGVVDSPDQLSRLAMWLVDMIDDIEFDAIFTSAYKGIALTTAIALEYHIRFPTKKIRTGYVRKERKDHGEGGNVVGYTPRKGDRVLLLDDVITTGGSQFEMLNFVKAFGAKPVLVLVAINRADDKLFASIQQKVQVPIHFITTDKEITSVFHDFWGKK